MVGQRNREEAGPLIDPLNQAVLQLIAILNALAGSLTISGSVTVTSGNITADTELTTADLDTGAGTDTRAVVGLVYAGAGGGTLVSAANPLPVTVIGSSSTQYTEGDVDTTITGTAPMWEDSGDTLRAVSMAKPLPVQPGTAITFPVSLASVPSHAVTTEIETKDYDTGAGTDTQGVVGIIVPASGGSVAVPGDATNGLDVDVTRVKPDGTNTMPSLDTVARKGFVALTDGTLSVGVVDETGSSAVDAAAVGGGTPHDSVDSGNPVKIGAKTTDYEPSSSGLRGPTAVAAADRANAAANIQGELITAVKPEYQTPSNIAATYNNTTTTNTSDAIDCWRYRTCTISLELDKSSSTTQYILIEVLVSLDGTNYAKLMNGPLSAWIYSGTVIGSGGIERALTFPICAYKLKIKVTCNTDATNTITVANPRIYFRT